MCRPVTIRAILRAFSTASAPPRVKNTLENPSGAMLSLVAIAGIFLGLHLRERQQQTGAHVGDGEHRETVGADV